MRLASWSHELFAGESFATNPVVGILQCPLDVGRAAIVAMIVLFTVRGTAEESFPFPAFVAHDRTQIHSGPGDDYYATDELSRGERVEVYQRAESGWFAIRPPASSFSWVSVRDIQLTDQSDVAEVVGSAAVSWIGTAVAEVGDHRWLVKLDRGESVTVLGKERRRLVSAGKSDLFCKILPPSGEFRWLHEDDIVLDRNKIGAIKDPNIELADFRVALRGAPRSESQDGTEPKAVEADGRKDSFGPRGQSAVTTNKTTRSPDSARKVALIPKTNGGRSETKPEVQPPTYLSGDLESQLRELDVQLSLIAAKPAETWDFTALRAAADQLASRANSTLERARVQIFLDKLSEFEGLKSRHALMAPKPAPASLVPKWLAAGIKADREPRVDPRFDGTGWLFPVHSSKKASPPYALLDEAGNILQFVSPSPGLNLSRYLRKEIGVIGQKDQPPTLEKPHLTAHRIIELDRHRKER